MPLLQNSAFRKKSIKLSIFLVVLFLALFELNSTVYGLTCLEIHESCTPGAVYQDENSCDYTTITTCTTTGASSDSPYPLCGVNGNSCRPDPARTYSVEKYHFTCDRDWSSCSFDSFKCVDTGEPCTKSCVVISSCNGTRCTFTPSYSVNNASQSNYQVNLHPDNNNYSTATGWQSNNTLTHTYSSGGSYTAVLEAKRNDGTGLTTCTTTVNPLTQAASPTPTPTPGATTTPTTAPTAAPTAAPITGDIVNSAVNYFKYPDGTNYDGIGLGAGSIYMYAQTIQNNCKWCSGTCGAPGLYSYVSGYDRSRNDTYYASESLGWYNFTYYMKSFPGWESGDQNANFMRFVSPAFPSTFYVVRTVNQNPTGGGQFIGCDSQCIDTNISGRDGTYTSLFRFNQNMCTVGWKSTTTFTVYPPINLTTNTNGVGTGSITTTSATNASLGNSFTNSLIYNCNASNCTAYRYGTNATLTATADAGSVFAGWNVCRTGTTDCTTAATSATTINLNRNKTATATFNVAAPSNPETAPTVTSSCPVGQVNPQLSISWTALSGATFYQLWRSDQIGAPILIYDGAGTTFVDTTVVVGTNYKYQYRGYNTGGYSLYGNWSDPMLVVSCEDAKYIPPGGLVPPLDPSSACPPATMFAGETSEVSVTMENTGSSEWPAGGNYKLGSQDSSGSPHWSDSKFNVIGGSVPINSTHTFQFFPTAPNATGNYRFHWKMVQTLGELNNWFGEESSDCRVRVTVRPYLKTSGGDVHSNK